MDLENTENTESMTNLEHDGDADWEELERVERRKLRMAEMRRMKKRQELVRRLLVPCVALIAICIALAGVGIGRAVKKNQTIQAGTNAAKIQETETPRGETQGAETQSAETQGTEIPKAEAQKAMTRRDRAKAVVNVAGCVSGGGLAGVLEANFAQIKELANRTVGGKSSEPPLEASSDGALALGGDVMSANGVFIDVSEKKILGLRDAKMRISPASMTKILTVLVAAEHTTDLDDTFEITQEITDYSFTNDCSSAGFEVGENVTIRDLFYGTVLPSGADAALALAIYTAGSHEEFVRLMNEKIDALGLSATSHFTNCVGLYNDDHYSTVYDIAVMLKAAYDNSFCREVLSARKYTTTGADMHPDGITMSNLFLRRIEDRDTKGEVLCAKTGFVAQSGNCAASLAIGNDGKLYICVTAHASGAWQCVRDHVAVYQQFLGSS